MISHLLPEDWVWDKQDVLGYYLVLHVPTSSYRQEARQCLKKMHGCVLCEVNCKRLYKLGELMCVGGRGEVLHKGKDEKLQNKA